MNIDELDRATQYDELGWLHVLAKAVLLNKVTIRDGRIRVEAFTEDEQ